MLTNDIASAWNKAASRHDTPYKIQRCWNMGARIERLARRLKVSSPRLLGAVAAELWRETPAPSVPAYVRNNIARWLENTCPEEEREWVETVARIEGLDSALLVRDPLEMVDHMLWARLWGSMDSNMGFESANKVVTALEAILFPVRRTVTQTRLRAA